MNITVLGSGMVGQTIASKLVTLQHNVTMGTRNAEATKTRDEVNRMTGLSTTQWLAKHPEVALKNFQNCIDNTDLVINATNGQASLDALNLCGKEKLEGKVILDIANPLDFSNGMPPTLSICNHDSLGETIQRQFPESKVVKSLNTMTATLMVNPTLLTSDHTVFVSGNDETAKKQVSELLKSFGWKAQNIIDLGDISTARGTEQLLPIWIRLWGALGTAQFNFSIVKS